MTILLSLLCANAVAGALAAGQLTVGDDTLRGSIVAVQDKPGGTRITFDRGSSDGIEPGDRGQLLDGSAIVTRFTIDVVKPTSASAFVPVRSKEVDGMRTVKIELSPGTTPPPLKSKQLGAGPLGSCADDYTMYRAGRIDAFTPDAAGRVRKLWIAELGWKHRVCADSTGMIYLGGVGDRFVTSKGDVKIRLRVIDLGYRYSQVEVIQGELDEGMLGDRQVVFRAKP